MMKIRIKLDEPKEKHIPKIVFKQANNENKEKVDSKVMTPSRLLSPVWVMALPLHAKFVPNNAWMDEFKQKFSNVEIDVEAMVSEWEVLFEHLSMHGIVLTLPSVVGLQDLHYVNSFVYLPHIKDKDVCIISRFASETRKGEEPIVKNYLESMGYECHQPPLTYTFEGEPCFRWLRDDIYIGSYGVRTTKEALIWIEQNFNCNVIKLGLETSKLFHGDTIYFPITPYDVMVGINYVDPVELKRLEQYANIIPIEDRELLEGGICNGIVANGCVYFSDLSLAEKVGLVPSGLAKKVRNKAESIVKDLGLEPIFIPTRQMLLQGAMLSCLVARLNWQDRIAYLFWKEGMVNFS